MNNYKSFIKLLSLLISIGFVSSIYSNQESFSERKDVQAFIQEMVGDYKFDRKKLNRLFGEVKERPKVISKIQHPYEEETQWFEYKKHFLDEDRIQKGVEFWKKYKRTLKRAEKMYGVPASVIVAIVGVESNYGEYLGEFRVIDSLSNLAFNDLPRHKFFRSELIEFLLVCREKNIDPLIPVGSYAGAIGQPQFMPSSFRKVAVDFSHSGRIDLTNDNADVIGSIAKYLNENGWERGGKILISLSKKNQSNLRDDLPVNLLKENFELDDVFSGGIFSLVGIDKKDHVGIIKLFDDDGLRYWLGLHNMYVITRYNTHIQYGMAVYELSKAIERKHRIV